MQMLLVDNKSSVNIIFCSTLEAMEINRSKLNKFNSTLIKFNKKESGLSECIKLPMTTIGVT